jgi:phosphoribosylaminoimidazole-succinocarboxamide synthase
MKTSPLRKARWFPSLPFDDVNQSHLAVELVGKEVYDQDIIRLKFHSTAAGGVPNEHDASKKIFILIDEALTPNSSRYWLVEGYKLEGHRRALISGICDDWLVQSGFKKGLESVPEGKEGEGWVIEQSVVEGTRNRNVGAVQRLMR